MKIEIDTHTHTIVSGHAYNTMKEMVQAAADKGLKGIAITEHAPEMPGSTHSYYFMNLFVVPRKMCGIDLLLGAELNIMNEQGEVDLPEDAIKRLDITIASIHMPCYSGEITKEKVTRAYLNAMKNPYIDIIGHPDDGRFPIDYELLVKNAKETGTLLEVNNTSLKPGGFRHDTRGNVAKMLEYCKKYNAAVVLGTDSHVDATIGEFEYAFEALKEAEFPEELVANASLEKLYASLKRNKKV